MARVTLDENESGSYTGDGTSNNGKCNANFAELFKDVVVADLVANNTTRVKRAWTTARTISGIRAKRHTAIASAGGNVTLAVKDGDGNTLLSTATVDAKAFTASFVALTLTGTGANLAIAAGEPVTVELVSDNVDATGGPAIVEFDFATG